MPESVQPGRVIDGKYVVERFVGSGGMAHIAVAMHRHLERRFAIKVMRRELAAVPGEAERFLREAQAVGRLNTVHVPQVTDVGCLAEGIPYIVMEYLEGKDLGAVLEEDGPLTVAQAADYMLQACEAVAEAHSLGIVHRDLKPSNMFLTVSADGAVVVKVLDFGISQLPSAAIAPSTRIDGSPAYMAPEQMETPHDVDGRADIWSLGVTLYELTTGRMPFDGESATAVHRLVRTLPPPPPSVVHTRLPAEFDDVVLRCLSPNREDRYGDVVGLAEALSPFGSGEIGQVGRVVRIAAGMFREQRLAQLVHRHGGAGSTRRAIGVPARSGQVALADGPFARKPTPVAERG